MCAVAAMGLVATVGPEVVRVMGGPVVMVEPEAVVVHTPGIRQSGKLR